MAGHTLPKALAPNLSPTIEEPTGSTAGADRRAHKRYELDICGALSRDGVQFIPCHIHDFCLGGMLVVPSELSAEDVVVAGKPVDRGDKLIVRCVADVGGEHLDHKVRARAVSVSSRGIGVSFERTDPDEVWRITQLVRKLTDVLRENRAQDRSARAPCSPMGVEQAVNASQLLEDARRRIESFLVSGMDASFQDADERLFAQANDVCSDADRTTFFDAMNELKGLKVSVESAFFDVIDRALNGLGQPTSQRGAPVKDESETELSLMDTGNFDDWLTTKNIISVVEPFLKATQFDLEQNLSFLANAAIDEENNPIGLTPLCLAFHDSIQHLGASRASRHAMLLGFNKAVVQNLESLYDDLNTMFVEGRVPQTLETEPGVASTSGGAEPGGGERATNSDFAAESERAESEVCDGSSTGDSDSEWQHDSVGQKALTTLPPLRLGKAFRAAGTLISLQSEADPAASAEIGPFLETLDVPSSTRLPDTVTVERQHELIDSMSILQRSPRFAQSSESGPLDLKQKLHTTWRSAGLDVASEHRMIISIVSNLVDAILDDPFLSQQVKTLVRRLAIPILKVAIQDNGFFDDQMHPARQMLDSLGRMDAENAEELAKVVDPVVNNIVETYETDSTVFANALAPLKTAVSRQRRTFQQNLERVVTEREEQQAFIKSRQEDAELSDGSNLKGSPKNEDAKDAATSRVWSRWLAEAHRCKPGDVVFMKGKDGHRQKLTLAWMSEDKSTFVLVDSHGNKAMSLTAQELAMQIKRGTAAVFDTAEMALTDRGTYRMLRSLHKQLSRNASHDRLTDVLTRKEFEVQLDDLITEAVRDASRHVMYALEIDGVPRIVEKAGKKTGKQLLRKLAQVIEKQVAKRGVVGRLGTARFGVLLNDAAMDEARQLVDRQCRTIAKVRCTWRGERLPLTVSAGVLEITPMSQGVTATLVQLDAAVDRAVKAGGNRIQLADSVDDPYAEQRLHDAGSTTVLDMLKTDQLRLRCQRVIPLVEDPSAKAHYEILLGVQQDEGTVSLPSDYIRAAERNHQMQTVDRWVIRATFQWISDNPDKLDAVDGYSINLSSNALSDERMLEFVIARFSATAIPPAKIIFEFPETAATANVALTADFVTTLKTYGCRFAIDDFGMAESSFSYLSSLPVDFVKINGKLVVDILESPKDLAVVKSINEIGHLLGKQTIAEFVENEDILTRIREMGVDYAQGFGIDKPSLLEEV